MFAEIIWGAMCGCTNALIGLFSNFGKIQCYKLYMDPVVLVLVETYYVNVEYSIVLLMFHAPFKKARCDGDLTTQIWSCQSQIE